MDHFMTFSVSLCWELQAGLVVTAAISSTPEPLEPISAINCSSCYL